MNKVSVESIVFDQFISYYEESAETSDLSKEDLMGKSIAKIKIKADRTEEFIKAVEKACPLIRQEEGCIFYELYQTEADPTEFYYCEEWRSEEDLKKHLSQPHVAELIRACEDLTDGDVTPVFWHKVV